MSLLPSLLLSLPSVDLIPPPPFPPFSSPSPPPGAQFSRLGDVLFPGFVLRLVVIPLRLACVLFLLPFSMVTAALVVAGSLLW